MQNHRVKAWSVAESTARDDSKSYAKGSREWYFQRSYVAFFRRRGMAVPTVSKYEIEDVGALLAWADSDAEGTACGNG